MNSRTWTFAELAAASPRHAAAVAEKFDCPDDAEIKLTVKRTCAYVQVFRGLCSYGIYRIGNDGSVKRVSHVPTR